jgi:hypothetical protein
MKQIKFFLFFVLFSFCVSAQNRPGVDYFPHTGFFDFIINYFGLTLPETGITGLT